MSLEAAIQENTAAVKELIAVMQSGVIAQPAAVSTEDKPKRGRPAKKEDAPEGNDESVKAEQPATTTEAPATTEPSATASAATASDEKQQDTGPSFDDVTQAIVNLNKTPGHGRDSVLKVFAQFLGTTEGKRVPDLKELGKNAEIIEFVDGLLNAGSDDDLGI